MTLLCTAERIAIADLPDYLEHHGLRVTSIEPWRECGLMVWTEDDDNVEHATPSVTTAESFTEQGGLGGTMLHLPKTEQLQLALAAEVS